LQQVQKISLAGNFGSCKVRMQPEQNPYIYPEVSAAFVNFFQADNELFAVLLDTISTVSVSLFAIALSVLPLILFSCSSHVIKLKTPMP
jgi:hypothetical protein